MRINQTNLLNVYLLVKGDPPTCQSCGTMLIINHILNEFRKYGKQK
jgi:hypothetical protein